MIERAIFTSVWDGGAMITTGCKVNLRTKEVFDIEITEVEDSLDTLDSEFVTIDGVDYPVSNDRDTEYWYE